MKRRHLIGKVQDRARLVGTSWSLDRNGGKHDVWRCGAIVVYIPRHREISEGTAQAILKMLEGELGEKWWR